MDAPWGRGRETSNLEGSRSGDLAGAGGVSWDSKTFVVPPSGGVVNDLLVHCFRYQEDLAKAPRREFPRLIPGVATPGLEEGSLAAQGSIRPPLAFARCAVGGFGAGGDLLPMCAPER